MCRRVVCARLLYRILLCKCAFGPRWPQVGVPEDDSHVSVSGTEKSYFKIYCNYIMYTHTHKPCLFSRDHRFFVVFFSFVFCIYSTRVVYYRRRHRLYSLYTIRGRLPLYTGNNITKSAQSLIAVRFFTATCHTLLSGLTLHHPNAFSRNSIGQDLGTLRYWVHSIRGSRCSTTTCTYISQYWYNVITYYDSVKNNVML